MILIDALYINKSGGKILLEFLIEMIRDTEGSDNFLFLLSDFWQQVFEKLDVLYRSPALHSLLFAAERSFVLEEQKAKR